jgi:hypothetical protein
MDAMFDAQTAASLSVLVKIAASFAHADGLVLEVVADGERHPRVACAILAAAVFVAAQSDVGHAVLFE